MGVGAVREQSFLACHATEGSRARQLMASARLVARLALKLRHFLNPKRQTQNTQTPEALNPIPCSPQPQSLCERSPAAMVCLYTASRL